MDDADVTCLTALEPDLLRLILSLLDERTLLRTAAVCTLLRPLAREPALWAPLLLHFFDGELPPELVDTADPLDNLRQQVTVAQHLTATERALRRFHVQQANIEGRRDWIDELDKRVAEVQISRGDRHATPGLPYYGCSGGAYQTTTRCYGMYVKTVIQNGTAAKMFGEQFASRVAWFRRTLCWTTISIKGRGRETVFTDPNGAGSVVTGDFGSDYGPLAKWRDLKQLELATFAGEDTLASSLESAIEQFKRNDFYKSMYAGEPDINPQGEQRVPQEGTLSLPKLLAGAYGGNFDFRVCGTSIGTIYAIACKDGTSIADYGDM